MKKVLSGLLSAAMLCGLFTVNAFAAPAEFEYGAIDITLSDTISKEADCYAGPIYKVNVGTTVTAKSEAYNLGAPWVSFGSCDWNSDHTELRPNSVSIYKEGCDVREEDGYKYATFTVEKPGLWEIVMMDDLFFTTHCAIYLEVVGEEIAEPEQPTETEKPAETETPAETEKPAEETPAVPAGPNAYTVQKYDTLGQISVNYYGSYAYHNAIYKANAEAFKKSNGKLLPGMVLDLPDTIGKAVRMAPAAAGEGETLYTVKAGDTLGLIAKATYGDVMQYKAIFERNADRLKNANTIYEGQVIVLPAK